MTTTPRRPRILFGVTGSVAAVKAPEIALKLVKHLDAEVKIILTKGGDNFWNKAKDYDPLNWKLLQDEIENEPAEISTIRVYGEDYEYCQRILFYPHSIILLTDVTCTHDIAAPDEEWKSWNVLGDQVFHIELRDWADIVLIAPLSAHSLAKIANGLCDDTLSCVLRAWDLGHGLRPGKPCIVAPAMNTAMYEHPLTLIQLNIIATFWKDPTQFEIIPPTVKILACGEVGMGALAGSDTIVQAIKQQIKTINVNKSN